MTDAQNDALEKIRDLVREHFDAAVLIVEDEEWREIMWHGGVSTGLGLCKIAISRLMARVERAYGDEL